ncbi:MAG TPA: hypothetical protein VGF30_02825, partial [Bacteroidia bacterium]
NYFFCLPVLLWGSLSAQQFPETTAPKESRILFNTGYRVPLTSNKLINSGHGIYMEGGFRPRMFSDRFSVAIFAGWGWKDNLWSTSFTGKFVHDYSLHINSENYTSFDSSVIHTSKKLFADKKGTSSIMPGCEMKSFHDYSVYYGLYFKLPLKYKLAVKLYTGSTRSHFQGPEGMITSQRSYNIIQLRRKMYGGEVIVTDPLHYFINHSSRILQKTAISVYYEYHDLETLSLYFNDGEEARIIKLNKFMRYPFSSKYRADHIIGLKFSIMIL